MRIDRMGMVSVGALLAAGALAPAGAQTTAEDVRRELQEMRRGYDAEMQRMRRDYETRIQQLENRVRATEGASRPPPAQRQATAPAQPPLQPGRAPAPELVTAPPPAAAAPGSTSPTGGLLTTPGLTPVQSVRQTTRGSSTSGSSFNPSIGVVLDGRFAAFDNDPSRYAIPGIQFPSGAGLGTAGFGIGESEISLSANIDDKLFGALIVALDGDGAASVEEAFIETLALPLGFTIKAGRFFSNIGYLNSVHRHAWDFADAALPYRAFLGNQYRDDGVQIRWVAPTPFLFEVGGELFRGGNYPFDGGHTFAGSGAAFVHLGDDITENMSFRFGLSHLRGRALARTTDGGLTTYEGVSSVTGLDAVFKWAPTGNPSQQHLKLQAEIMYREDSGGVNGLDFYSAGIGWYAQAIWRFLPSWEAGLRADSVYVDNYGTAISDGLTLQGYGQPRGRQSAALTYYTSEFGRFRVQFNRDQSGGLLDHQFLLQYTVSLGAHGAHKY